MVSKHILYTTFLSLLGFSFNSFAALVDRGGGLIYDTVLDITWLQNANYAYEPPTLECFNEPGGGEICFPVGGFNGQMTFEQANSYVDSLEYYDAVRDVVYDDWRLPEMSPIDGNSFNTNFTNNGTSDEGYARTGEPNGGWRNGDDDPVSELGHMYYMNLLNTGYCSSNDVSPASCDMSGGLTNTGLFINIEAEFSSSPIQFWTGTLTDGLIEAGYFNFKGGFQGRGDTEASGNPDYMYAWAVRDGDVAVVPLPAAVWLFGSGLIGLIGIARRKK